MVNVLVQARKFGDLDDLRRQVARWEALGVSGVVVTDHLFVRGADGSTRRPPDPFVVLAAIGALSDRLTLATLVSNIGLAHPALTVRHAAQLAVLFGGHRVLAGIGAGWNAEEFAALGSAMPPFADRMNRLEEAARMIRQLFDEGEATVEGRHVVANRLPLAPLPSTAPQLMLGGGSARLLDIAGKYADHLDLNGSSRRTGIGRRSSVRDNDIRRLSTTLEDLEESSVLARTAAAEAGRDESALALSIFIDVVLPCRDKDLAAVSEDHCRRVGVPRRSLTKCPYVLLGSREQMQRSVQRTVSGLGLSTVIVQDGEHLEWMVADVLAEVT